MNASTLTNIVNELTADGWHVLNSRETDTTAPIVNALQRHRVRASDSAVLAVRRALHARRRELAAKPVPAVVDDQGLPVPDAEALAAEAAYLLDIFWMFGWEWADSSWSYGNGSVNVDAVPADLRRTAFRAGMTAAAAHGVPDNAPTTRQVVNALFRRMARDGRISR